MIKNTIKKLVLFLVLGLVFNATGMEIPKNLSAFFSESKKQVLSIVPFSGGMSLWGKSYDLQVTEDGKSASERYVYRMFIDDGSGDFDWELYYSESMASLEIAPKIIFASPKGLYWITEFIGGATTLSVKRYDESILKQVGDMLKKIHIFSPKSEHINGKFDYVKKVAVSRIKTYPICSMFSDAFVRMNDIEIIFAKTCKKCFCHNDLGHGANMLWDGKKIWAIDWEMAGYDYPYFDLASPISLLCFSGSEKEAYLRQYFGREMTKKEDALVFIGEQYGLLRYAISSIALIGSLPDSVNPKDLDSILEWTALLTGKMKLTREEMGTDYGKFKIAVMLAKQAFLNMSSMEYRNALTTLEIE